MRRRTTRRPAAGRSAQRHAEHTVTTTAATSTSRRPRAIERGRRTITRHDGGDAAARAMPERESDSSSAHEHRHRRRPVSQTVRGSMRSARGGCARWRTRSGPVGLRSGTRHDISEAQRQRHDRPGGEVIAVDERPEWQRALELGPEAPVDIPSGRRRLRDRQADTQSPPPTPSGPPGARRRRRKTRARREEERDCADELRSTPSACRRRIDRQRQTGGGPPPSRAARSRTAGACGDKNATDEPAAAERSLRTIVNSASSALQREVERARMPGRAVQA